MLTTREVQDIVRTCKVVTLFSLKQKQAEHTVGSQSYVLSDLVGYY